MSITIAENVTLETVERMAKDIARSSQTLGPKQARFLVDSYYSMQEWRIATQAKTRMLLKNEEPSMVMEYTRDQMETLEKQVARALHYYVESEPFGVWMTSIMGIGPVIAAGLLSSVDWPGTNVAPKLWSYAGLNPSSKWEKGKKRPWNAFLKTLCYKVGESFVKVQNKPEDFYGKWYAYRKGYEWRRNLSGELADQAERKMREMPVDSTTNAYLWYTGRISPDWAKHQIAAQKPFPLNLPKEAMLDTPGIPLLPPAHIHSRARRYAVKMFLSHCVEVSNWLNHGQLGPMIYIIAKENHADYIYPHNNEIVDDIAPGFTAALRERYGPKYQHVQQPAKSLMYLAEEEA